MPNNPGRVDGDYSIGEHEEVKYVDPPAGFGEVKKSVKVADKRYLLYIAIVLVVIWLILVIK